jgi:AcrR family transcriptional regulator
MAPPRKHDTDRILDAARAIVLEHGPRAASVGAIARLSGAPTGTLYHRFGNRDRILSEAWLRALGRFQALALDAAAEHEEPIEVGVAMAASILVFAREHRDDARLLLSLRPADLLDADPGSDLRERIRASNSPLEAQLRRVARGVHGRADARALDAVTRAIVDLPYGAVRRHAAAARVPAWLARDVVEEARVLLRAAMPQARRTAAPRSRARRGAGA